MSENQKEIEEALFYPELNQIDWIQNYIKENNVYSIGSPYEFLFMLARNGKKVFVFVDDQNMKSSLEKEIEKEEIQVKENIENIEFSNIDEYRNSVKTIVLAGNIGTVSLFEKKLYNSIDDDSLVIITIPFEVNSNKQEILKIFDAMEGVFITLNAGLFKEGLGIILKKKNKGKQNITYVDNNKVFHLIDVYFKIGSSLLNTHLLLGKENIDEVNLKLIKEQLHIAKLTNENVRLKQIINQMQKNQEEKNKMILSRLDKEEKTLMKCKELIYEYNRLEARYYNISKKYELLSNAKLGKLTLKYWKMKNRIPKDF